MYGCPIVRVTNLRGGSPRTFISFASPKDNGERNIRARVLAPLEVNCSQFFTVAEFMYAIAVFNNADGS